MADCISSAVGGVGVVIVPEAFVEQVDWESQKAESLIAEIATKNGITQGSEGITSSMNEAS